MWIAENRPEWRVWSNNTGSVLTVSGRYVKFGVKGSADIIGITGDGKFLGIEVKTGKAKQNPSQKAFERMITDRGGKYFLVRQGQQFSEVL